LAQATSLEGLRQACASVAQIYDTQAQMIRSQGAYISQLFKILQSGILGASFVFGLIFLYIYFATRKHVSPDSSQPNAL
jgi:hypothetical protein